MYFPSLRLGALAAGLLLALSAIAADNNDVAAAQIGVEKNPESADAYRQLGQALMGQTRYDEALFFQAKALNFNPRHKGLLCDAGITQVKLERHEAAQVLLGRLQEVCSDCAETAMLSTVLAKAQSPRQNVSQRSVLATKSTR
jgi:tetratricopeptide (TPR) repeat protein